MLAHHARWARRIRRVRIPAIDALRYVLCAARNTIPVTDHSGIRRCATRVAPLLRLHATAYARLVIRTCLAKPRHHPFTGRTRRRRRTRNSQCRAARRPPCTCKRCAVLDAAQRNRRARLNLPARRFAAGQYRPRHRHSAKPCMQVPRRDHRRSPHDSGARVGPNDRNIRCRRGFGKRHAWAGRAEPEAVRPIRHARNRRRLQRNRGVLRRIRPTVPSIAHF